MEIVQTWMFVSPLSSRLSSSRPSRPPVLFALLSQQYDYINIKKYYMNTLISIDKMAPECYLYVCIRIIIMNMIMNLIIRMKSRLLLCPIFDIMLPYYINKGRY